MASCKAFSETVVPVGALAMSFSNVAMSARRAAAQISSLHAEIFAESEIVGAATGVAVGAACCANVVDTNTEIKLSDNI